MLDVERRYGARGGWGGGSVNFTSAFVDVTTAAPIMRVKLQEAPSSEACKQ